MILALLLSLALFVSLAFYCSFFVDLKTIRIYREIRRSRIRDGLVFFEVAPREIARKISEDPFLSKIFFAIDREAQEMLSHPLSHPSRIDTGFAAIAPDFMKRVVYLSFVYLLKGDKSCSRCAVREMLSVCELPTWYPSDHLANSVITAAMAIGYDWLSECITPDERVILSKAILGKGLRSMYLPIPGNWWKFDSYNHAQVGYGGLGLAALILLRDFPKPAAKALSISIRNMRRPLVTAYLQDGEYKEGPAYWVYGTTYSVLFIEALENILGNSFELDTSMPFMKSPWYFFQNHGPSSSVCNFSDGNIGSGPVEIMWWFAKRLCEPVLTMFERDKSMPPSSIPSPLSSSMSAFSPMICLWAFPIPNFEIPDRITSWISSRDSSFAIHRAGWNKKRAFVALKGGSPGARHGQMDCGAFIFESGGVRWGIDLGSVDYALMKERGIHLWSHHARYHTRAQRWRVFRLNNFSHSTLTINNRLQNPRGRAKILSQGFFESRQYTLMDLSPLYTPLTGSVRRKVCIFNDEDGLLVQDEIVARERPLSIRWTMVTRATVDSIRDGGLVLSQNGQKMTLTLLEENRFKWQIFPSDPPPAWFDESNPDTRLVGFYAYVEAREFLRLSVRFKGMVAQSSGASESAAPFVS